MPKIYYISDYHFYHYLPLIRSRGQFASVKEMNEYIIEKHNKKVKDEDHVYIMGDVIVCPEKDLKQCMDNTVGRLRGHLHLITGNHDTKFSDSDIFRSYFETVNDYKYISYSDYKVVMFHYPILFWYKKQTGAYHVYGHVHDEVKGKELDFMIKEEKAFNACVELNDYEPCTLKELEKNNRKFRKMFDKQNICGKIDK